MLGPPPNPGPYGPRLIANPVTPGRASNPVGAIVIIRVTRPHRKHYHGPHSHCDSTNTPVYNECSDMEGGVLPRIKKLLHRIGER